MKVTLLRFESIADDKVQPRDKTKWRNSFVWSGVEERLPSLPYQLSTEH
jgi:hypothetical protein